MMVNNNLHRRRSYEDIHYDVRNCIYRYLQVPKVNEETFTSWSDLTVKCNLKPIKKKKVFQLGFFRLRIEI